jgi:hypothetical protein
MDKALGHGAQLSTETNLPLPYLDQIRTRDPPIWSIRWDSVQYKYVKINLRIMGKQRTCWYWHLVPWQMQPSTAAVCCVLQWRTCGGRSHDRLQLEFRATRWSLVVPTVAAMREVGLALWEILQELDSHFLEEHALLRRFGQQGKIWGFHGGEVSIRGLLRCDAVQCCGRIQTFQRTMLPSSTWWRKLISPWRWRQQSAPKRWYRTTTQHVDTPP